MSKNMEICVVKIDGKLVLEEVDVDIGFGVKAEREEGVTVVKVCMQIYQYLYIAHPNNCIWRMMD